MSILSQMYTPLHTPIYYMQRVRLVVAHKKEVAEEDGQQTAVEREKRIEERETW